MNETKNLISIVIPAFNEERYIRATLESLNKQTYPRESYEVIVVDNNSSDKTAAIAVSFGARVVKERQQGYVFTFNQGVFSAKSELVAVTDADTQVAPDWLEKIAQVFLDQRIVALTGEIRPETNSRFLTKAFTLGYDLFVSINFLLGKPHLTGPNLAFRKKFFEEIGGLDIRYKMSPDVELGLRLKKYGQVVFRKDIWVRTSTRRWKSGKLRALWNYALGYFNTVWFRRPPKVDLEVYR